MDSYNSASTKPLYRGTQFVWYVLGLIEVLLVFRFVLKLLGANPDAGFSNLIYVVTDFLVAPFVRVFNISQVSGSIFEWATLLAMFVYWALAIGIINLLIMSKSVSRREAATKLGNQER